MSSRRFGPGLILVLATLTGCGGGGGEGEVAGGGEAAAPRASEETKIKIKANEAVVATYKLRGKDIKIEVGPDPAPVVLKGGLGSGGDRKYEKDAAVVYEVSFDGDGFKVKDPGGKLLWKVKVRPEKVQVDDEESMEKPIELKSDGAGGGDVEVDGVEVAEVKFHADRNKMKVKDASGAEIFESNTDRASSAYGLLAVERIPVELRHVLAAELLARP